MGNHMDKVVDGLYVGGALGAKEKTKLLENKITHILSVHDNAKPLYPDDFVYKCIQVSDNSAADLSIYFYESIEFIHGSRLSGGSVFIHCAAGISRSVTLTVLYIMVASSLNLEESLAVVQHCRELANPNFGFRMQLKSFHDKKLADARKHMKEKFPASEDLMTSDEKQLREILEKVGPRTRGRDMLETFNPDAFTSKNSD